MRTLQRRLADEIKPCLHKVNEWFTFNKYEYPRQAAVLGNDFLGVVVGIAELYTNVIVQRQCSQRSTGLTNNWQVGCVVGATTAMSKTENNKNNSLFSVFVYVCLWARQCVVDENV